jgi:hypothetical protein
MWRELEPPSGAGRPQEPDWHGTGQMVRKASLLDNLRSEDRPGYEL